MKKVKAQELIDSTTALQQRDKPEDLVTRMAAANELADNPEVKKEIKKYGSVPVIYLPTRDMARPVPNPGLLNFIEQATTVKEVEKLLQRGKDSYNNASPKTVRRWEKAAALRIQQLNDKPIVKKLKKVVKA